MTKNLSSRIQYTIFACLLWFGLSKSTQAQTLFLDYSVDSNCILTVSLLDTNSIVASFNPPYHFSVGGINVNSNSLGSAIIDISSLPNGGYDIEVIDGNQNYYYGNAAIACGQPNAPPSFALIDSFFQGPTSCTQCNASGQVQVANPTGGSYTFEWSDGVVGTNSSLDSRNDLCPGVYTIVVTDSIGTKSATSLTISCNNAPLPQVATCFPNLTRYLGTNNEVILNTNDLSAIGLDSNRTQAYIIHPSGTISGTIRFDCNDLGYHYLTLLLIDSIQQISDTCSVLVNIQDSLNTCSGLLANTNSLVGNTTDASNCNICDGSYTFLRPLDSLTTVGPFTFVWSDGSTVGPIRSDLCPNQTYVLSVSDFNGTVHTATINLDCPGSTCIDSNQVDSALFCPPVYAPVCGCDSVTYINACVAAYTYGITYWAQGACGTNNGLSLNISTTPDTPCDTIPNCSGAANIFASGGQAPYTIIWSDSFVTGFSPTNICSGNYIITVSDFSGNTTTSIITIGISGCVWPGDTDDNTVANNFDLLPIGLAYGDTGFSRIQPSITWTPTVSEDWSFNSIPGLPNHKHFDTNGNGVVDSSDVNAIVLNYGRSYFRSSTQSLPGISPFGIDDITVYTGDTISTPIYLGNIFYPVANAYGVAFTVNYNTDHMEAGSVSVDFNNSWLGNDLIHIQKTFDRSGQVEIAISRKDKMPISGYGPIGAIHFTIKDDLIMGRLSNTDSIISPITISAVRLIDHQNIEIGTTPITGNITIAELLSINTPNKELDIQLFPNPTDGLLNIISKEANITSIQLFNATGQLIDSNSTPNPQENKVSMQRLATGIYFLSIQTDQGVFNQKIQVIH
jgi:hypothetical protein